MRLVADQQPVAYLDPLRRQRFDFGEQCVRIDHDPVADHTTHTGVEDAGGEQMQDELRVAHVHRMAGVVSALVARDDRHVRREQVDDLALAFVTPLRTDDRDIHVCPSVHNRCGPDISQLRVQPHSIDRS